MNAITTLEEAKAQTYGMPWNRAAYREGFCVKGIWSGGRASIHSQCTRKSGFGPCGLYCKQHDPERVAEKEKARSAKWKTESDARQAKWAREAAEREACADMADPVAEVAALRECAEALRLIVADLPSRRDWLDPSLEDRAKDALAKLPQP